MKLNRLGESLTGQGVPLLFRHFKCTRSLVSRIGLAACTIICLAACGESTNVLKISGRTMGTGYQIQLVGQASEQQLQLVREKTEKRLNAIDRKMSTYRQDSEISRFNSAPVDVWFDVSSEMVELVSQADELYRLSKGAFDVGVGSLVNLWGFGSEGRMEAPPANSAIRLALQNSGVQHLKFRTRPPALYKAKPLYLDLSAIAKGYAVDQLASLLNRNGWSRWLVEIGGEVRVQGSNGLNSPWRIGVERPSERSLSVQRLIRLSDGALATSGNYRNFFFYRGVRYSHMIDPRSGWPVSHNLASVTVLDKSAARADGLATLLYIMGPQEGLELAEDHNLAALFILQEGEAYVEYPTSAFTIKENRPDD